MPALSLAELPENLCGTTVVYSPHFLRAEGGKAGVEGRAYG